MADIYGVTLSAGSSPTVKYFITYTKSRPNNNQMTYSFSISCSLSSTSSYILAGYALMCTITINGTSAQVRIKANDNDDWYGTSTRMRYVTVTCASTTANATQPVTFKVVSDGRVTISSGVITNSSYTVTSAALVATAPTAPTSVSITPSIYESTGAGMTIKWSGATAGLNNAIQGYQIYNYYSSDQINWTESGNWGVENISSVQSQGTSIPRGYFFRVRIVAKGLTLNSGYSAYSNIVRHNTVPSAPTSVVASPTNYSTENITVSWSGASSGASSIKGFMIARRTSTNNSTWSAWTVLTTLTLSATGGSYTDTSPPRTLGTYSQYGVWTIDALDVYSAERISNSILCNTTACGAPTTVSLSATVAEGSVILSWSGASGGAGNAITAYIVGYQESEDGVTWSGNWQITTIASTATSGTTTVSPPATRGHYRRFRVRTRGAAGSAYDSTNTISSNTLRKNILPEPPTVFSVTPAVYVTPQAFLSWSGTVRGTSAIRNYIIQQSTSMDGVIWGAWETVTTVTTTLTYGSFTATPSNVAGTFTRYRIGVTDALGAISAYVISASINMNRPPLAPIITAPQDNSLTYNTKPMVLIRTQAEPDGHPQTIYVYTAAGYWVNNVENPEFFSKTGASASGMNVIFTDPEVEPGRVSLTIQCRDEFSTGASVTRSFTILPSAFEEITANETHVKASHILALRAAVGSVRQYFGLTPYAWSHDIVQGRTQVRDWPYHVLELRVALDGVITILNDFDSTNTTFDIPQFDWLPIGTGRPRADVMNQIRDIILLL